ncbi:MAG: 1-acyl-sn-glycerol-3-phosphate acyltransferase [Desulfovibrio sp.]|nr:1-acyl-sn-glycerol-3-phosphate acyltransferase [Desulfovibrio sp.]
MWATFCIYGLTLLWSLIALPLGYMVVLLYFVTKSTVVQNWLHWMSCQYGKVFLCILTPWVHVCVNDRTALKRQNPCIVIANHQSILDLFLFAAQEHTRFVYVLKAWPLKKLFFFTPFMWALNYVPVENQSAENIEQKCQERLQQGVSLVFFPEGTRSKGLGRFHAGAFRLACRTNTVILPLVIENSASIVPKGSLLFHRGTIRLHFLQPLHPKDFAAFTLPHRAMLKACRQRYQQYLPMRFS